MAIDVQDRPIAEKVLTPLPLELWREEFGDVLWWKFPIEEPPYVGSPIDCGVTVEMRHYVMVNGEREIKTVRTDVGGWPGYHTHWTPIVCPEAPKMPEAV